MTTPDISRALTLKADGETVPFPGTSGRVRLTGREALSLLPAFFRLDLWNLTDDSYLRLARAKTVAVLHGETLLLSAAVRDALRQPAKEGTLSSLTLVKNEALWEAPVSCGFPAGTTAREALETLLSESRTGIPLLSFPGESPVFSRGRSFHDRCSRCIQSLLEDLSLRASLVPAGLRVIPAGGLPVSLTLTEHDLPDAPLVVGASGSPETPSLMILTMPPAGFLPGETVHVKYGDVSAVGILRERFLRLDTGKGPWTTEMLLEVIAHA